MFYSINSKPKNILGKCSAMKTCSQGQNIETLNSGSVIKDSENMLKKNVLNFRGNDLYPSFADLNPPSQPHPKIANISV